MHPVSHAALLPLMRPWRLAVCVSWINGPRPADAPHADVDGPNPDRVLLLGGLLASGCGVLTHQLGLIGHIARQLSSITGCGAEMEARTDIKLTIRKLPGRIRNLPPIRSDAVMVMVGVNDALRLTPVRAWKRDLKAVIEAIRRGGAETTPTLIIGIPPLGTFRTLAPLPRRIAARHACLLNDTTKRFCRDLPQVIFVPLYPAEADKEPALRGSSEIYQNWSREVAVPLAGALHWAHANRN